jgi:hypothetical protein
METSKASPAQTLSEESHVQNILFVECGTYIIRAEIEQVARIHSSSH